jgi:hypothetical protein
LLILMNTATYFALFGTHIYLSVKGV